VNNDPREYSTRSPVSEPLTAALHILVVEDNSVNQELVKTLLANRGHRVAIAQDGIEALEVLRRNHFDLIFMDIQMPKQDGYETTQLIRKASGDGLYPNIPIIAMTAYAMRGDRDKCLLAGMNDYLSKPIAAEELDRVLNNYIFRFEN
jgi:CheY-like chemotaxis protein